MSSKKTVSTPFARDFLNSESGQALIVAAHAENEKVPLVVGERGRLHPAHIEIFNKANKGKVYATKSGADARTITLRVPAQDKKGRNITVPKTVTTAYARLLLGHPAGRRGKFNREALVARMAVELAAGTLETV